MNQPSTPNRNFILLILKFISRLFKCIWIFFPPILFVLLGFVCFWILGQGKDLMVAFAENEKARALFFIAIAFWTYVSWYSSRIIAYVVARKQGLPMRFRNTAAIDNATESSEAYFQVPDSWLKRFPRLIGFSCVVLIELAVFQLNIKDYDTPGLSVAWAKTVFVILFFLYLFFNNRIDAFFEKNIKAGFKIFYVLLALMVAGIILLEFIRIESMMPFILVMILFLVVFVLYVHLRRMGDTSEESIGKGYPSSIRKMVFKILAILRIPLNEFSHFTWFNIVCFAGLIFYFATTFSIPFSWMIGPFPFVILAFAVLAGLGNIITLISIRLNLNFHLIILLLAALIPPREIHYVRLHHISHNLPDTVFRERQTIDEYYTRWLNDSARAAVIDADSLYNVYFVMANGGASRSGYWTAAVLGTLDDTTRGDFSKHLFCLSGASGGSVGNATFFSLLHEKQLRPDNLLLDTASRSYLETDFLTYTLARMLGPDYLNFILHFDLLKDRAAALEEVVEAGREKTKYDLKPDFNENFSSLITRKGVTSSLPVICINVTRMQDGNPGVVSNIMIDSATFNDRVDVLELLPKGKDIRLSTAAILGARFPYVSPAGRIDKIYPASATINKVRDSIVPNYFVDGGYFDNSGAGVVSEIIRAIQHINKDSIGTSFGTRAAKLRFVVIHITNSPPGEVSLKKVSPLTNDLAAPLLTLAGAFDMQTTVNDSRLVNLLKDIDSSRGVYYPISLYKSKAENPNNEPEEPYAMNWFISQHTLNRMNDRLHHQPALDSLIDRLTKK